jgi:hypothetical protein
MWNQDDAGTFNAHRQANTAMSGTTLHARSVRERIERE